MARLTDRGVAALKPTGKREQIADDNCKGLYLILQPTGRKSWSVRYRTGSVQRRFKIGDYPTVGLSAARDKARHAMAEAQAGRDPQSEREQARADTVEAVVNDFKEFHLDKLKSGANAYGFLHRSIVAEMGHRPIRDITKRDVSRMLLSIVASGREVTANRTFAHVRKLFNWAHEHGYIDHPPTDRMKMPVKEQSRERFLNDEEISLFWQATERMDAPYQQALRILLLTGQRHSEVSGMVDAEIEGDLWTLPSNRTKNGLAHVVPLSSLAVATLASIPRISNEYYFTTTGDGPIWNLNSKADECWRTMCEIADRDIDRWTPHDLRRTLETGMARLGIAESLIDRLTNHVSAIPKIRRTYNRHDYLAEKRSALDKWQNYLRSLIRLGGKSET